MRVPFLERAPDLDGHDPAALAAAARAASDGVTLGATGDERSHLDPLPHVIAAAKWDELAAGLAQRVRALEAWCATTSARSRCWHPCGPTTSAGEVLEEALDRLDELVVKPRVGHGGESVVICPRADVERVRAAVAASPDDDIAQELVPLSRHATVLDGRLEPRHVDPRPFVFLGPDGSAGALPGGLIRVPFDAGAVVVNSSQNGGAKDTWVM